MHAFVSMKIRCKQANVIWYCNRPIVGIKFPWFIIFISNIFVSFYEKLTALINSLLFQRKLAHVFLNAN